MSDDPGEPLPMGRGGTDPTALADKAVLGLCELLALLFGLPFGEDLYNNRPIAVWHYFYLAIAILFAISGPMWPLIRMRAIVPESVSRSLSKGATDARVWLAVLLILFVYGTGPDMWQLSALIGGGLLLIVGSLIVSALSGKRIIRNQERRGASAAPDVLAIHTCRIEVYEDKLPSELYIEFYVTIYNSEGFHISINAVSGTISIGNMPETVLSSPMIIGGSLEAAPKSELTFTLRQHMPSSAATTFHHAISNGNTMVCGLRSLIISIARSDNPVISCPLQLWDEIRLVKSIVAKGGNLVALSAHS